MRNFLATLALMTLTVGVAVAEPNTGSAAGSEIASRHLANIEAQAVQIRHSSDLLESFAHNPDISWEAHVDELLRVRNSVRSMARSYLAARESQNLSLEQRQALTRVAAALGVINARSGAALSAVAHKPAKPLLLNDQYNRDLRTLIDQAAGVAHVADARPMVAAAAQDQAGL